MTRNHHPRRLAATLLAGAAALALVGCSTDQYPHSVFTYNTEFNAGITDLHKRLFFLATIVFIFVESLLLYVIFRFRRKPGQAEPKHVHGNTTLEVLWTAIPAVILIFIAIPTVRTIFRTQAKAKPGALQVEVIGHQWWWEFRYPEYNITTANELYLPLGRTVNFALKTADVLHSFWIPALGGKRDLIANHTNYLWFTPDSTQIPGAQAWYGHCTEYCGASHANMRIRAYTVTPAQFESWVKGQQQVAALGAVAAPGQSSGPQTLGAPAAAAATVLQAGAGTGTGGPTAGDAPGGRDVALSSDAAARNNPAPTQNATGAGAAGNPNPPQKPAEGIAAASLAPGYFFPAARLPKYLVPNTPLPKSVKVPSTLVGDAERGRQVYSSQSCIGCHYINGNPASLGKIGPNLTHLASRHTIGAGLYPNDTRNLFAWIKNTRALKPGAVMPTLGKGEIDPVTKRPVTVGGLTDQQIMDIVAYLQALK